jgi:hypothetical protein
MLVGAAGSIANVARNRGSGPGVASPVPSPTAGPSGAAPTATPANTVSASPTPLSTADESSPPADTVTPAPQTKGAAASADLTFRDLMLDYASEPGATTRTFSFTTDGPGSVSAQVVTAAPLATSRMCIEANGGADNCETGATPGFVAVAPAGDHAEWTVTLVATETGSTPVVDVAFRWPTKAPAITLSHGRLQGAPNPDSLRGATATFKTRSTGTISVSATWPTASVDAALTLSDLTASPGSAVDQSRYTAAASIEPVYSHAVKAGRTYQIQLQNSGADSDRPDLSITISFP